MFEPQSPNGPSALTDFPREVYMSFRSHRWGAAFGVAGLALVLGACSSSTAPVSLSDPVATAAQAAALDSAFAAPVVASFQSLGSSIHPAPPVVHAAVRALGVVRPEAGAGPSTVLHPLHPPPHPDVPT